MRAPLSEPTPSREDMSSMTKAELLEYAESRGVDGVSGAMRKADIIAVLEGKA